MANNTFGKFFRKSTGNTSNFAKNLDSIDFVEANFPSNDARALRLAQLHAEFVKRQEDYSKWAAATLLGDVQIPELGNTKFRDSFTLGKASDWGGKTCVILNPKGSNGNTGSKYSGAVVNALLHGFGTRRYAELRHWYHRRDYDASLPRALNVLTAFDTTINRW